MKSMKPTDPLDGLMERGVICPAPNQVFVDESVRRDRIAPGVVLHPGTRLLGEQTSIGPGGILGEEGPATVENCCLGHDVRLKGGYYSGSVFLDGAVMGSAAHVRGGTLLEEQSAGAHAVGFKQTILFPFVVTGSLINFCDILMAGGTSRKDHSEVGSSYVHFNYTPWGDKATASLVGDVPRGVCLDQPRIFLGGQGGLVGPTCIAFGTVVPAGQIRRTDIEEPGLLVASEPARPENTQRFHHGLGRPPLRVLRTNLRYIGNLRALRAWYRYVRGPCFEEDPYRSACVLRAISLLQEAIEERVRRLDDRIRMIPADAKDAADPSDSGTPWGFSRWPDHRNRLLGEGVEDTGADARDAFLSLWSTRSVTAEGYLDSVRRMAPDARVLAQRWLDSVVAACRVEE